SLQGAGGIGGLLGRSDLSPAAMSHAYYHADKNGNVTALINEHEIMVASYLYDPFGNTIAKSGPLANANRYQFSSKETHQPSSLLYFGLRFYDATLQRWLTPDPDGSAAGQTLYEFTSNSPVNQFDPDGARPRWDNPTSGIWERGYLDPRPPRLASSGAYSS